MKTRHKRIGFGGVVALSLQIACIPGREFRAVATPAFQSGVSQILNGILDGVFAAVAVEPENLDDSSDSASTP